MATSINRRNIEANARCRDLAAVRTRAVALGAREAGIVRQRDLWQCRTSSCSVRPRHVLDERRRHESEVIGWPCGRSDGYNRPKGSGI